MMHIQLVGVVRAARADGMNMVMGGDFNAQVGPKQLHDIEGTLGNYGLGELTRRSEIMLHWCGVHGLVVANSLSDHGAKQSWTYSSGGTKRQLYYILVDACIFKQVKDCSVIEEVNIGSDHRPNLLSTRLPTSCKTRCIESCRQQRPWQVGSTLISIEKYCFHIWGDFPMKLTISMAGSKRLNEPSRS